MTLGYMLLLAGSMGLIGTLVWTIVDIVKAQRAINCSRKAHQKRKRYVIPPTSEMYPGIREVQTNGG